MTIPFHPLISHFPIALAFIIPLLSITFALLIKSGKMLSQTWLIIIALNLTTVTMGYVAIKSGVAEEAAMEKVLEKKLLQTHESTAEVFVGLIVISTLLSLSAFFLKDHFQFAVQMCSAGLGLVGIYFAYQTAILGGELVYKYGAATAYVQYNRPQDDQALLPVSGVPAEANESLKTDENDYGNADDNNELEQDDDEKQED